MKKCWIPFFVLLLLPASYSEQRPAERLENAHPPHTDSIQHQTQEPEETILYFPDYVDGGGWSVQLALSNVDPDTAAQVVVEVYDQDGGSIRDLFDSGLTFEVPALGSRVLKSSGTGTIRRGWIQVRTGTDSVSGLLTYKEGTTGIEVSVEPAELGDRFALFVEESADVGAGVAVFKPETAPSIQLRVRDEEGNDPLEGAFVSRGNFHQEALTLPEWFTVEGIDKGFLSDFRGLLFLRTGDESTFAPLGLRFGKRNQSLSSVPAIRDETQEPMETTLYFPDYVDGSGWSVQLALSNVDAETAAEVSVEVFDEEGQPVRDLFDAESAFRILSLGSRVLKSAGAGAIRRGWIEVESDSAAVSGLLTYRQSETGVEVSVKPVELGSQFALFVEESSAIGAGVAIFKRDAAPNVELRIRDEEGNDPLKGVFIPRGYFHQDALTLPEWLGVEGVDTGFLRDFQGLLFIRSEDDSQFAPLGLRFGKASHSLSSVPAIRIVDGDGIAGGQAPPPTVGLSVSPSSINWGESVTLTWSSTNAESVEITPDVGAVPASGSRRVTPRTSTTYRITVRGAGGQTRTASVTVGVAVSQQDALTAIYRFTGGPDWFDSRNWGSGRPLRDWHGITVDNLGRVTRLVLNNNRLTGEFPPELSALTHLTILNLSNNALTGPIPVQLGALRSLTFLSLENNELTGPIPPQLGSLLGLKTLALSYNALTGHIPPEFGALTNLTFLALRNTELTGPIPPQLGALVKLTSLNLQENALTGPIPPQLGALTNLTFLALDNNALTGPIPPQLGALVKLTTLGLRGNALTGRIPAELGALANLTYFSLNNNELTGPIPPELGSLANLKSLAVYGNNLTGPIPPELGALTNVTFFSFRSNTLTGSIPPELRSLSKVTVLDLSDNALTGSIPPELGSLANLQSLVLRDNFLTGPIPSQLGSLANLTNLNLANNNLTGSIPAELGSLANLEDLLLNTNDLTGPIPSQIGSLGNLTKLHLQGNALTGLIPPELGSLANLTSLSLGNNALTGPVPAELGSLANLRGLNLRKSNLAGPLPGSFLRMDLESFWFDSNEDLCIPGNSDFVTWSKGIENYRAGASCNDSDRAVLKAFFEIAGGSGWTNSDRWRGDGPLEEWYGVSVDSQGRVTALDLSDNGLEGRVPGSLGRLSQMTELRIGGNALAGRLPLSLSSLPSLGEFRYADTDLCAPTEEPFRAWMNAISSHAGTGVDCAPPTDRQILTSLYDATGGPEWSNRENWLTNRPLEEWHGVTVDTNGRVTRLDLRNNDLTGEIPPELGALASLEHVLFGRNELRGRIPSEFGSLVKLRTLDLGFNRLMGPIPAELGSLSRLESLFLDHNELTGSIPPDLGALPNLNHVGLHENQLVGTIPHELGSLRSLRNLNLGGNQLTGPIPAEFASLPRLESLFLDRNELTGSIPPDLGALSNLKTLNLGNNGLKGPVPPELGSLSNLEKLWLEDNALAGSIPPDLGALTNLEILWIQDNDLSGPIPSQFGDLESLRSVVFTRNTRMSGALPAHLTGLQHLEELLTVDTGLCAPSDAGFQDWLSGVRKRRAAICASDPPTAYLTQAVQSRDFPVPLVADEEALLRVFVTSGLETGADLPPVRATFYRNGSKTHVVDIPGKPVPIPKEVDEGDLTASANARIPGWVVKPGLEMVIDVDPQGTLGPNPGVAKRIPESGRLAVDVRTMPDFDLTVIPFLWTQSPDSSILDLVQGMAQNPGGHSLLGDTRDLMPINELDVKAHASVLSTSNNAHVIFAQTVLIRAMEGASGYYMGMMAGDVTGGAIGLANRPGWSTFSIPSTGTMAHEIGHNFSLYHGPCGNPIFVDPSYPESDGSIGAWGYDFSQPGRLLPPVWRDLMGNCRNRPGWVGDYHFTNALRYRMHIAGSSEVSALVAAPAKSLLLWGGAADGTLFLEPAFVVDAPAALPQSDGEFEITGRDAGGEEFFSFSFTMREVADGDGRSSFVFVLPVQPGWDDELASITLSGPGGSVRLDEETDRPVTILRNPRTGEIRGILRRRATGTGDDAVSALALEPGMEVLTSRGIPETEEWSR